MNIRAAKKFTLTELLMVMAIIAILGTLGFVFIGRAQDDARRVATLSVITNLYNAIEMVKLDTGSYPAPQVGSIQYRIRTRSYLSDPNNSNNTSYGLLDKSYPTQYPTGVKFCKYFAFSADQILVNSSNTADNYCLMDAFGTPLRYRYRNELFPDTFYDADATNDPTNTSGDPFYGRNDIIIPKRHGNGTDRDILIYSYGPNQQIDGLTNAAGHRIPEYVPGTLLDDNSGNDHDDVYIPEGK